MAETWSSVSVVTAMAAEQQELWWQHIGGNGHGGWRSRGCCGGVSEVTSTAVGTVEAAA